MTVTVVTPITQEPLTTQEVRQHLRLDFSDDDSYLALMISEAREFGEAETRRAFAPQGLQAVLEIPLIPSGPLSGGVGYRQSLLEVPLPPVTSIESIEGETSPGIFQVIDSSNYVVDLSQQPCRVYLLTSAYSFLGSQWTLWIGPYNPRFRVNYHAGYSLTQFPFTLKRAMLELIAYWYDYREGKDDAHGSHQNTGGKNPGMPPGIQDKFEKYRVYYG